MVELAEDKLSLKIIRQNIDFSEYEFPKTLKYLAIVDCNIESFDGTWIPDSIREFVFNNNRTDEIINLHNGIVDIEIKNNNIDELILPESVEIANISCNSDLQSITCGDKLRLLDISATSIDCIDDIPESIEVLLCNNCDILTINKFPPKLQVFCANNSEVEEILCPFPLTLEKIDLGRNDIKICPAIPTTTAQVVIPKRIIKCKTEQKPVNTISVPQGNKCYTI